MKRKNIIKEKKCICDRCGEYVSVDSTFHSKGKGLCIQQQRYDDYKWVGGVPERWASDR